ncbi:MAG: nucleotidyl transferase AbiEii/AbiGii toxin family protein [Anaerolineales bacterium]|nr:nucleotidyl transferase AbiEii/AbiGii toxin family protein [Anaerolineales bacterium]
MLTRSQIQRLAQRHGIGVQVQERDYLQHLLLFLLFNRSQALVFKGGTALRIVYRGNRYSEDLDFNGPTDIQAIKNLWNATLAGLRDFGIMAEMRYAWQSDVGYSFDTSYQGPLFDGRDRTKGKVRVDISLRQENVITQRALVSSEYDDVRPFVVTTLSVEHLLAEKVRALLMRGKPRDLYDVWLLTAQGVRLDASLVYEKLRLYDIELSRAIVDEALKKASANWERDLRPLLPQFIRWEEVSPTLEGLWNALQL